ncbi:FMRFamide-related neuropeptides-like [Paramacrobiotus metropolitanus]|uniref:FMRFamide-related neuropeptides-like n=1 Tax=Paramacrobiotus metropolitanus TaxID=2943436 RepID=UPI002445F9F9|nr:FMRFamide-related neuropeptides-like [Paramacrobiotus metropolitanus]
MDDASMSHIRNKRSPTDASPKAGEDASKSIQPPPEVVHSLLDTMDESDWTDMDPYNIDRNTFPRYFSEPVHVARKRADNDDLTDSSASNQQLRLRFGRSGVRLRFGRSDPPMLRFGRGDPPMLRFGRPDPLMLRFGREPHMLRFGRGDPVMLRFGRDPLVLRFGK